MDKMFEVGLEQRKATLGAEYVENTLNNADDFTGLSGGHDSLVLGFRLG